MSNQQNILVVDDEKHMTDMLKTFFEINDYNCLTASNGFEALEKMRNFKIDIVITDMKMPKMNGLELLKRIKREFSKTAAVLMTAFTEEYTTDEALNSGADGYITKPFRNKELLVILRRIKTINEM